MAKDTYLCVTCMGFYGIAITKEDPRNTPEEISNIVSDKYKWVGFEGTEEYKKTNPGGDYKEDSSMVDAILDIKRVLNSDYDYDCLFYSAPKMCDHVFESYDKLKETLNLCIKWGCDFIKVPTMAEVRECEGFEKVPKKNLWFCSDWSG